MFKKTYSPRYTVSIIEKLEIRINGESRRNINIYICVCVTFFMTFTCEHDAAAKSKVGL
jgi:hypothetical protein